MTGAYLPDTSQTSVLELLSTRPRAMEARRLAPAAAACLRRRTLRAAARLRIRGVADGRRQGTVPRPDQRVNADRIIRGDMDDGVGGGEGEGGGAQSAAPAVILRTRRGWVGARRTGTTTATCPTTRRLRTRSTGETWICRRQRSRYRAPGRRLRARPASTIGRRAHQDALPAVHVPRRLLRPPRSWPRRARRRGRCCTTARRLIRSS